MLRQEAAGGGEAESAAVAFGNGESHFTFEHGHLHRDPGRGLLKGVGDGGDGAEAVQLYEQAQPSSRKATVCWPVGEPKLSPRRVEPEPMTPRTPVAML